VRAVGNPHLTDTLPRNVLPALVVAFPVDKRRRYNIGDQNGIVLGRSDLGARAKAVRKKRQKGYDSESQKTIMRWHRRRRIRCFLLKKGRSLNAGPTVVFPLGNLAPAFTSMSAPHTRHPFRRQAQKAAHQKYGTPAVPIRTRMIFHMFAVCVPGSLLIM